MHNTSVKMEAGSSGKNFDYNYEVGAACKARKLTSLVVNLDLHSTIQRFIQSLTTDDDDDLELRSKINQGLIMDTQSKIHEICLDLFIEEFVMVNSLEDIDAVCYLKKHYNWMGVSMMPDGDFLFLKNAAEERNVVSSVWKIGHIKMEPAESRKFGHDVAAAAFIKRSVTLLVNYLGLLSSVVGSLLQSSTGGAAGSTKIQVFVEEIESKIDEICSGVLCKEEGLVVYSVEDLDAVCYLKKKYDWKGKVVVLEDNWKGFADNRSMVLRNAAVGKNVSYSVCRRFS